MLINKQLGIIEDISFKYLQALSQIQNHDQIFMPKARCMYVLWNIISEPIKAHIVTKNVRY